MEMEVVVCSRTANPAMAASLGVTEVSLDELLASSDIVTVHTPSTAQTKGMVNAEFLGKMKDDAVFINTARGNVVDEDALHAKLESCSDFWVGTDVFNGEPSAKEADFQHKISQHPRVYGTHHCGASTQQAEFAIGMEAVRIIEKFNADGELDAANWVNK
jgi:D-3-phosphoglycerate dehydrogenase